MPKQDINISSGVVHETPADLREALMSNDSALERWNDLTPLARNEWICWTITTKRPETRKIHIERTITELLEGVRRPCCWAGCIHREDKILAAATYSKKLGQR
jgi:hypothetical protein